MTRKVAALLAFILAACTPASPLSHTTTHVTRIVDGDTIHVAALDVPVRIVGIDAPESATCWGKVATSWVEETLAGEPVTLERATAPGDDPYGRRLVHVRVPKLGGELYAEAMVGAGLAEVATWPPNDRYQGMLGEVEGEARSEGVGVWGPGCEGH